MLARGNFGGVRFDPTNAVATGGNNHAVSGSFEATVAASSFVATSMAGGLAASGSIGSVVAAIVRTAAEP